MTAATQVTAPPTPPEAPIHFPDSVTRLHDQLTYQCACNRLMQGVPTPPSRMGHFDDAELAAMTMAYNRGVSPETFIAQLLATRAASLCIRCHDKPKAPHSFVCATCLPPEPPKRTIGAAIEQAHRDAQLQRAELRKWD